MAEVKWIKIVTDFFDDEKIELIEAMPDADTILIVWIKLLTLAGKKNLNGYIFLTENIPYTDEMLATIFNRPINTVRMALEIFKKFSMVNYNGNDITNITNWEKYQNIEGMERIRELSRQRQAKYIKRKKKKEEETKLLEHTDVSKRDNDGSRLDKIRVDKIREEKKDIRVYVELIFKHWQFVMKHPKAKPSKERYAKINTRLKEGFTYEQCIAAIDGCAKSSFHMGKNNDGTVYDSIDLIFKNASKLESFISRNKPRKLITSIGGKAKTDSYDWGGNDGEK